MVCKVDIHRPLRSSHPGEMSLALHYREFHRASRGRRE